jgi:glyoxylase-like metal-dependent hydrolase (beta-lactamase superfamily II)
VYATIAGDDAVKIAILPVTPFQQNCSLVWDEQDRRASVIDPGGDVPRILAEIERLGLLVEKIVLTHGHIDHAGGVVALQAALQARPGAAAVPVVGPDRRDEFLLQGLAEQGRKFGFEDARDCVPDEFLSEGGTIKMANLAFEILHCPGHTPGSIVLFSPAARFAFVGDVLFRGSVGRTDFPYGDGEGLIAAITTKLLPLGDDVSFLCGHGQGSTIGRERETNPFLRG